MKLIISKKSVLTLFSALIITPFMFINVILANNITDVTARQIALDYINDASATISHVKYENKKHRAGKYEVYGFTNSSRFEIEVNSATGNVVDSEIKFNTSFQNNSSNSISEAKAREIALNYVNDPSARVGYVEFDYKRNGIIEYEVNVFTNSAKYEIEINASTGEFISIDAEYYGKK